MSLLKNCKVTRVMNAVAAGTSDQTSSIIDMQGYEGVMFLASFGTLTATQVTSMRAQQGAAAAMGDAADLEGSTVGPLADDDDNQCLVLDVYRPRERYVRVVIDRATANAVIDGVVAIQYGPREKPTVQDATTIAFSELHVSPAEGTA
jgi:hypothetical protein